MNWQIDEVVSQFHLNWEVQTGCTYIRSELITITYYKVKIMAQSEIFVRSRNLLQHLDMLRPIPIGV